MNSGSRSETPLLHERFEEWTRREPHRVALRYEGVQLSYGELDRRADELALRLAELGAGPEQAVALLLPRGVAQITAILAVLKSGGAYVPLDPAYPVDTLTFMLGDSAPAVLVAERGTLPPGLSFSGPTLWLDEQAESAPSTAPTAAHPPALAHPENLAYIIYTSGSTGRPKGTAVSHRAMSRLWQGTDFMRLGPDETVLQYSSACFDASVLEIWAALSQGASLVIAPDVAVADLGTFIAREGITLLWLTAGAFHALTDADPAAFSGVRQLLVGGDVISPERVRAVLTESDPPVVINGYGPTEAATFTTTHTIRELAPDLSSVPIGVPVCNTTVHILDGDLDPVRPGQTGELCVGGPGVARCYVGRPDLTAERFVPDPFRTDGGIMYRTGDQVWAAPDGTINYVGRSDDQVKVRGFRIQLRDVEARLSEHPEVREAVALAPRNVHGDRVLTVFYTGGPGARPDRLRTWLRERVPGYLIPSELRQIDRLPLSANGKTDRMALARAVFAGGTDAASGTNEADSLEARILGAFGSALGRTLHDPEANLFDLGLDSISAARATLLLRRDLGLDISSQLVFEQPTAQAIAHNLREASTDGTAAVELIDDGPFYSPSFGQRRLWTADRIDPGSTMFNVGGHVLLAGAVEPAAVEAAVARLVERHETLRTDFPVVDGEPVQRVSPPTVPVLPVFDLRSRSTELAAKALDALTADATGRPFVLDQGPLWRLAVVLLPNGTALSAVFHHILIDGWSVTVFFQQLADELKRLDSPAPEEVAPGGTDGLTRRRAYQYRDFAAWQRQLASTERMDRDLAYWRNLLDGASRDALPATATHGHALAHRGNRVPVRFDPALVGRLGELASMGKTTLFPVLLAALQIMLARRGGRDDICVGFPVAYRTRPEFLDLIGYIGNNLIVRGRISPDDTAAEVVLRAAVAVRDALAHQDVPLERLVQELEPGRSGALSPLFQVLFAFQNASREMPPYTGFGLTVLPGERVTAKSDLMISLVERDGGIDGYFEYSEAVFDRGSIEVLVADYEIIASRIALEPEIRLAELGIRAERTEKRQLGTPRAAGVPVARRPAPPGGSRRQVEELIEEAWCSVLNLDRVGRTASFFELGGNSFLLAKLHLLLEPKLPGLTLIDMFRYPTVSSLAAARTRQPPPPHPSHSEGQP
ncbi:amino acid adenylation domain-containing protein [Streptomyces sp. NPDC051639]|uniref:amino acid adenylation domain-containing protein n=1 Tax=Streptomyces sp. NPDC051639 TaxID=3155671 RepID=UPI00343A27C1